MEWVIVTLCTIALLAELRALTVKKRRVSR